MSSETKRIGFNMPCPHCSQEADVNGDGGLVVQLGNLSLVCMGCEESVTRADLERMIADAQRLVRWLELAATV